LFDARPDPADPSPTDALERALPGVLDRLTGLDRWLLWIECDRLLPPWVVQQDVFEVYVEDLVGDEEAEEPDEEAPDDEDEDDDEPDDAEEPDAEGVEEDGPHEEPVQPWANPPTGWFDRDDFASWELLHRTFAAVATVFDAELGRVFDLLRGRGLDRTATWVLTADHGIPLGEHGVVGLFRPWLHEELVHVPLIVRLPEAAEAGRRVAGLTQPADLTPTLAKWLGVDVPAGDGFDVAPLIAGRMEAVRDFAVTGVELGPAAEWAIRTPDWALLLPARPHPDDDPREPMLFEKPDDRWEVNDLRPRNLETAEELERVLRTAAG
jgi:arylsulfatase A-like enzyme